MQYAQKIIQNIGKNSIFTNRIFTGIIYMKDVKSITHKGGELPWITERPHRKSLIK